MAYFTANVSNIESSIDDRVLRLTPVGKGAKDSTGLIDKRLFTGENKLHAIQEARLWYLKYDMGAVPGALQQKFTNFNQLMKFVTNYFKSRNIEVTEER